MAAGKVVLIFGSSMGVALAITILSCAFGDSWWPMMMVLPFVLMMLPLMFTQIYGKSAAQGDESAKVWYNYGMCLLGAVAVGIVAMPVMFVHLEMVDGMQFGLWLLAVLIASAGAAYFIVQIEKVDDGTV